MNFLAIAWLLVSAVFSMPAQASPIASSVVEQGSAWEVFYGQATVGGNFPLVSQTTNRTVILNYSKAHSVYFCWGRSKDVLFAGRGQVKAALIDGMEQAVSLMGLSGDIEETHCVRHDQVNSVPGLRDAINKL